MRIALSFLLLATACAPSYPAKQAPQPLAPISPGDRLRVTHDDRCCTSPSIGIEASLSRDSLVLQPAEGTPRIAIARSSIARIERWNSGRRHMATGALVGLVAGAATFGVIGYQSQCSHCDGDWRPLGAFAGVVVGGGTGLLAGLAIGAHRRGFWETLITDAR